MVLEREGKEVLRGLWRAHCNFELRGEAEMKEGLSAVVRGRKRLWRIHFEFDLKRDEMAKGRSEVVREWKVVDSEMDWERLTGVVGGFPEV